MFCADKDRKLRYRFLFGGRLWRLEHVGRQKNVRPPHPCYDGELSNAFIGEFHGNVVLPVGEWNRPIPCSGKFSDKTQDTVVSVAIPQINPAALNGLSLVGRNPA